MRVSTDAALKTGVSRTPATLKPKNRQASALEAKKPHPTFLGRAQARSKARRVRHPRDFASRTEIANTRFPGEYRSGRCPQPHPLHPPPVPPVPPPLNPPRSPSYLHI